MLILLFNYKEGFHHHLTVDEIDLIKNTRLFSSIDIKIFDEMLHSIRLVKHQKGDLILREGEKGNEVFVITDGSVTAFTHDMNGIRIPLKILNKGDYFGEQAQIGKSDQTRNANIEAIEDTTLIKINGKFITHSLQIDTTLRSELEEEKYKQAMNILSLSSRFYSDIESIFTRRLENMNIMEFRNNEYIFKTGDKPDNVYIILHGKVKLLIPDKKTDTFSKVLLNRGHLFGELGVINNTPRSATAIAHSSLRLLAIDGEYFKKHVLQSPQLQQMLATLNQIYQIPMKGTVEEYFGDVPNMGSAITTIYKLDDGRLIISSKVLSQDLFTMSTVNRSSNVHYLHKNNENSVELEVADHQLIGIKSYGICNALPDLCQILLDNTRIDKAAFENFELTGEINVMQILKE